jgi:DNA segregation ATPase FtsK/SpoIIIE, S-DNA-T family
VLPSVPLPRERTPFPVVATIAPVVVGVGMVLITGSIISLAFAALGPVIAIGSLLDGRRATRRRGKIAAERFARDVERVRAAITSAHDIERAAIEQRHPGTAPVVQWDDPQHLDVRIGTGDIPSCVTVEGAGNDATASEEEAADLAALASAAAVVCDAPIEHALTGSLTIVGPSALAIPLLRSVVVQLASRLSPSTHSISVGQEYEEWIRALPHRVTDGAPAAVQFHRGDEVVATLDIALDAVGVHGQTVFVSPHHATARGSTFAVQSLSSEQALEFADAARTLAQRRGIVARAHELPEVVAFSSLTLRSDGLTAPLGHSARGEHTIDLIAHGPHAVVGGTTGSGKSELLVTWLLGLAAFRSPTDLTFLLFDFKGGSSFGSLPRLPHCVGLVTDLDAAAARRALESIGAELRFRERTIAESGVKSIDDLASGALARLIVVIDEFASVAETFPDLYAVFADLAARGRSLGVHLVLCTQRPAGVVRDAVMGNIGLRISLRVTNASDSSAVLGTDAASHLAGQPIGRACVAQIGHAVETIQVALTSDTDVVDVSHRWATCAQPRRPWLDPLPATLALPASQHKPGDRVFGLVDNPAEQAQPVAVWRPRVDGSFVAIGGTASGKSTALAAIASTEQSVWVPSDAAAAWDAIVAPPVGAVVIIDDLDRLMGRLGGDYERDVVDRLIALARDPQVRIAISVQRLTGGAALVAAECEARLLLRMASKHDHVLAGGASGEFDVSLPAGGGLWRGLRAQVALAPLPQPTGIPVVPEFAADQLTIGVSSRPDRMVSMLTERGIRSEPLEQFRPDEPDVRVVVADPESWQNAYSSLSSLRARCPILFYSSSLSDVRAIARTRELPPPLTDHMRHGWFVEAGEIRRVSL